MCRVMEIVLRLCNFTAGHDAATFHYYTLVKHSEMFSGFPLQLWMREAATQEKQVRGHEF